MVVVHQQHIKLAPTSCRDLLAVGQAHPLALSGLSPQRPLAVLHFAAHLDGDHARLYENQSIDNLLVSRNFAAFIHGSLLAGLGLASNAGKHAAGILEEPLDLIVVQHRPALLISRKHCHALVCHRVRAQRRHLVLDAGRIRRFAGDKFPGNVLV